MICLRREKRKYNKKHVYLLQVLLKALVVNVLTMNWIWRNETLVDGIWIFF